MNEWRSQHFLQEGIELGVPRDVLTNAVATAKALQRVNRQLPPLFTLRHLAHEVGVPYVFLRAVASRSDDVIPYRVFKLKKRSVGHGAKRYRYICVPNPFLLRTQRWIHDHILSAATPHEASFAYSRGSRIVDMAQLHCGAQWMMKLDVTNFFESILETDVYRVFTGLGYQPLISFELARLCTRLRSTGNPIRQDLARHYSIWKYNDTRIGHLPQGAPTSPLLSNFAVASLDADLAQFSEKRDLIYTRYADDLTFSTTDKTFTRIRALQGVKDIYEILRSNGLWPNRAKTHIVPPRARKVVLGLLVDQGKPRLTREFKDALRMHIYYLTHSSIGPIIHASNRGFDSILGLQHHVFGLAAFAVGIEPDWGRRRFKELREVPWPTANEYFP